LEYFHRLDPTYKPEQIKWVIQVKVADWFQANTG
jgi:hypothetical protein